MYDRGKCYDILFRLQKERSIDIEQQLHALAQSGTDVPDSVIAFIESNSIRTLSDFLHVISPTKPFYKNLLFNQPDDISKYVKALLSMVVHIKITIDKNPDLRDCLNNIFDVKNILDVILVHIQTGDNDRDIIDCAERIKAIYLAN